VLRHLIYTANSEAAAVKKTIFLTYRCLHCHAGRRASSIPKKEKVLAVFDFQMAWLQSVQVSGALLVAGSTGCSRCRPAASDRRQRQQ